MILLNLFSSWICIEYSTLNVNQQMIKYPTYIFVCNLILLICIVDLVFTVYGPYYN